MKTPDSPNAWIRVEFDEEILKGLSARKLAETEANRDLIKPIEQLLCDFHEEAETNLDKQPVQSMIRAQKRMVSMMAKVALSNESMQRSNDSLQNRVYWLTVAVAALTLVGTTATVLAAIFAYLSLPSV